MNAQNIEYEPLAPWESTAGEAEMVARAAADRFGLPQTVYRDGLTAGWWHTHPLTARLSRPGASVKVTVLPQNYFH